MLIFCIVSWTGRPGVYFSIGDCVFIFIINDELDGFVQIRRDDIGGDALSLSTRSTCALYKVFLFVM